MALVITSDNSIDTLSGETLLETLERAGYDMEYQCREGYCGSCRTRLLSGQVEYQREPLAWLTHGEILPCSCQAVGTVRIDISRQDKKSYADESPTYQSELGF